MCARPSLIVANAQEMIFGSHRFGSRRKEGTVYSSGVNEVPVRRGSASSIQPVAQQTNATSPTVARSAAHRNNASPARAVAMQPPARTDLLSGILSSMTHMHHRQITNQFNMGEVAHQRRMEELSRDDPLPQWAFKMPTPPKRIQSAPVRRPSPLTASRVDTPPPTAPATTDSSPPTLSTIPPPEPVDTGQASGRSTQSDRSASSADSDTEDRRLVVGRTLMNSPGPRKQMRSRVTTAIRKTSSEHDIAALVVTTEQANSVSQKFTTRLCPNCQKALPREGDETCDCGVCIPFTKYGETNEYEMSQSCPTASNSEDVLQATSIKDARTMIHSKGTARSPGKRGRAMAGAARLASNESATMLIERTREMAGGKGHFERMLKLNSSIDKHIGDKFGVICSNVDVGKETRCAAQQMLRAVNAHNKHCTRGCDCSVETMMIHSSPQMLAWLLAQHTLEAKIQDAQAQQTDLSLCVARELQHAQTEINDSLAAARKKWFRQVTHASTVLNELLTSPSGQVDSCPAMTSIDSVMLESCTAFSSSSSPPLIGKMALQIRPGSASSISVASPMEAQPSFIKAALARFPVSQSQVRVAAIRLMNNDAFVASLASDAATRSESADAIAAAVIYICSTDARLGISSSQMEAHVLCNKLCEQVESIDTKDLLHLVDAIRRYIRQSHNEPDVTTRFK